MNSAKAITQFKKFIKSISSKNNTGIVFHRDTDGVCSAAIAFHSIKKLFGKSPKFLFDYDYNDSDAFEKILAQVKKKNISRLLILDIGIDQNTEFIKQLEKHCRIIHIDHHKIYNNLSSSRTTFIKASFLTTMDPSKYVTSKMCFDLFSAVADVSELDWVSCTGIIGDMNYDTWRSFFDEVIAEKNLKLGQLEKSAEIINACSILAPEKFVSLCRFLQKAKHPTELIKSDFSQFRIRLYRTKNRFVSSFWEKAEHFPKQSLHFYEIKSKLKIKSTVVDAISQLYRDQTIIVLQRDEEMLSFSARRQDFKIKCNYLLEQAVKGISGGRAGGHIPAAAGSVSVDFEKELKENIIKIVKSGSARNV